MASLRVADMAVVEMASAGAARGQPVATAGSFCLVTALRSAIATIGIGWLATVPASAQSGASMDQARYDVGVGASLFFRPYLDTGASVLSPSVWFTVPAGRFGLQVDWLRSVRGQPLQYTRSYRLDDPNQEGHWDVASETHHVEQMFSAAIKWPFPRLAEGSYWLFGGAWLHYTDRWCRAVVPRGGRVHGARFDFPPGFDCSRAPVDEISKGLVPLYGLGFDWSIGSWFFGTVQYRARLIPVLGDLRLGAGVRW